MAKSTNPYTLTVSWAAISTVGDTVLVSINPDSAGRAEIAVATVVGDLAAGDRGHQLFPVAAPAINFYNLGAQAVFARKRVASETVILDVTEY